MATVQGDARGDASQIGAVEVPEGKVITFPEGIYGFEEKRRFALLAQDEDAPWCFVQALDEPDLSFVAMRPAAFFSDYEPEVPPGDRRALGLSPVQPALLLCLVSLLPEGRVAVNTRAPLVINPERRLGRQVILPDERYPVRFVLPLRAVTATKPHPRVGAQV